MDASSDPALFSMEPAFTPGSVFDDHELFFDEVLGEGLNGAVYGGLHRETGDEVAIKLLPNTPQGLREAALHQRCATHPNVVRVLGVFRESLLLPHRSSTGDFVVLVMERLRGGELFARVQAGRLTEAQCRAIVREVAAALTHIHGLGLMHADVKLENVLLTGEPLDGDEKRPADETNGSGSFCRTLSNGSGSGSDGEDSGNEPTMRIGSSSSSSGHGGRRRASKSAVFCKLADFGFAHHGPTTMTCYTPYYVAPELLAARAMQRAQGGPEPPAAHTEAVDAWALGVMTYMLLSGAPPFTSKLLGRGGAAVPADMRARIMAGSYVFGARFMHVSDAGRDLIRQLLTKDPARRLTAAAVLSHPWLAA